ncbi:hypothetical protein BH23BAC1_BH23BAC1_17780 [soil metagenome]
MQLDKNILKQYFRSGSRPTQKQFYELIDNCYNEAFTSFVPGYHLLIDEESDKTISSLKREAGKTILVPFFNRINTKHHRFYHYSIPIFNLGSRFQLDKIIMEVSLPKSEAYSVKDRSREVQITQNVKVGYIRVFNGSEQIYESSPDSKDLKSIQELQIKASAEQWNGISIDIEIAYDIKSDIAVSDQFDITGEKPQMLEHVFGSAGCIFKPNE